MAKVTIDSSGRYVPRSNSDKSKSKPETVPVEERNLPAGDVALRAVQSGEQSKDEDVPEVRREE